MTTDTSEKGLEALIVADMTARAAAPAGGNYSEAPEPFVGLHNWLPGDPKAYDCVHGVPRRLRPRNGARPSGTDQAIERMRALGARTPSAFNMKELEAGASHMN